MTTVPGSWLGGKNPDRLKKRKDGTESKCHVSTHPCRRHADCYCSFALRVALYADQPDLASVRLSDAGGSASDHCAECLAQGEPLHTQHMCETYCFPLKQVSLLQSDVINQPQNSKSRVAEPSVFKDMFMVGASVASVSLAMLKQKAPVFTERMLHDAKYRVSVSLRGHQEDMEACNLLAER